MHEDLIRSARWRIRLTAVCGLVILALTMGAVVFPVAWILGAASTPATGLGIGWDLLRASANRGLRPSSWWPSLPPA